MSDFTGETEEANIVAAISVLCSGRVWESQVPDDEELDRLTDGGVKPYIVVNFAEPSASAQGRNIATGEQGQPQLLSFRVDVFGGDADSVKETAYDHRRILVGFRPSDSATPIKSSGGQAYSNSETGSRPTRFKRSTFYRTIFNA